MEPGFCERYDGALLTKKSANAPGQDIGQVLKLRIMADSSVTRVSTFASTELLIWMTSTRSRRQTMGATLFTV